MKEAAAIKDGVRLQFSITGGEPFLDFPLLLEIVAFGAKLGAGMSCVSNAYWATSDSKARALLGELKSAGLYALGVSTSRFHQQFIKRERVERALQLAKEFGLWTMLKCPLTSADVHEEPSLLAWARAAGAHALEAFPVLPYLRKGAALPDRDYLRKPGIPEGVCPAPVVTIREDGKAYTCCTPGGFEEFLSLGNVFEHSLEGTYRLFHLQGRQRILRFHGPAFFAKALVEKGKGHRLRSAYASVCDLCSHIASDPEMAAAATETAQAYEREFVESLFSEILEDTPTAVA
jgi:MoaA/NifB/PqqE/SkfB family radical SAM enzyme